MTSGVGRPFDHGSMALLGTKDAEISDLHAQLEASRQVGRVLAAQREASMQTTRRVQALLDAERARPSYSAGDRAVIELGAQDRTISQVIRWLRARADALPDRSSPTIHLTMSIIAELHAGDWRIP